MIVTNTSAAVGMLTWMLMDKLPDRQTNPPWELCKGAMAGLAAITPASGYVNLIAGYIDHRIFC